MYSRSDSVHEDYEEPLNIDNWLNCPKCNQKPWVWIFDNGSYAKCCCRHKYDGANVSSESIGDVYRRTGSTIEYSRDNLMKAWNEYVLNTNL